MKGEAVFFSLKGNNMTFGASMDRDANRQIISEPLPFVAKKTMILAGGTTNDPGDFDGTGNPATLFTVTGDVLAYVFATCSVDLAGASATLEVGVTGSTASIIAQTTATGIDAGMSWKDATPAKVEALATSPYVIVGGADIIQTTGTANITAGSLVYYCYWRPLSSDGNVVSA